jgi:hypothetical protein
MKRTMILFVAMLLMTVGAKAGISIYNNTSCPIQYSIRAHNNVYSTCALQSVIATVAAGGSASFTNLGSVTAAQGWQGGLSPASTSWGWDSFKFTLGSSGIGDQVGNVTGGCSLWTIWTGSSAVCSNITVEWIYVSPTNVIVDIY